jgi:hypothetical protein
MQKVKTAPAAFSPAGVAPSEVQARPRHWTHSFTGGRLLLLLVIFLFALYPEVILGSHSFFDRDFGLFTYPLAHYARAQLWQGRIPLWNPLSHCGLPFLAQWNTGLCYPLAWFYLLLPLPWSLNYFCLGHLLLAGWGMYWLARRWTANPFAATVAGLAYALNGFAMNCLMWTGCLAAYAWLPIIIYYVSRGWREGGRPMLTGIIAATMQMLAGAPEFVLLTWIMLGSMWFIERAAPYVTAVRYRLSGSRKPSSLFNSFNWDHCIVSSVRLLTVALLVTGLSAVQLLPFLQFAAHSDRSAGQYNAAWSMPVDGLANFLVPLFHCSKTILGTHIQVNQQWTTSYYIGIAIIPLAAIGAWKARSKKVWWLAAAAAFGILMALGDHTFIYPLIKRIPPFGMLRYPIKFILPATFALPLLAAFAIKWAFKQEVHLLRRNLIITGATVLVLILLILSAARFAPAPDEVWRTTLGSGFTRAVFLLIGLSVLFLIRKTPDATRKSWGSFALLALLGFDLITHTSRQNPTVQVAVYDAMAFDKPMPKPGESRAMISPHIEALLTHVSYPDPFVYYAGNRKSLFHDCNLLEDIPKVNGFFPMHLKEAAAINELIYAGTNYPAGLLDFMSVSQLSSDDRFWQWVSRDSAMPLITGGQKPAFADSRETLNALASPTFKPKEVVYLPADAAGKVSTTNATRVHIQQTEFSPSRISATAEAEDSALVVISQNHFPCWKAFVDGHPTSLWRANHAFEALEIPAGKHEIRLEYRDTAFQAGVAITLGSAFAWLILFWRSKRLGAHSPCLKLGA